MAKMTQDELREAVEELASAVGGEYNDGYSGRGMCGAECVGIDCDDADSVIERAREFGLPRPSVDNMGKGYICYWPSIKALPFVPEKD